MEQTNTSIYHQGELEIQQHLGVGIQADAVSRAIRQAIPAKAGTFLENQKYAVLGTMDQDGDIWSSFILRGPGFAQSTDDGQSLSLLHGGLNRRRDPVISALRAGGHLGCLFIELETRRRIRVNGVVEHVDDDALKLNVSQAYGNCPKYIQRRELKASTPLSVGETFFTEGNELEPEHLRLIESADTFFVASADESGNCDASHRGGVPGFVQFTGAQTLRIPDYSGNNMFNTLGNFQVRPQAGLCFVDFTSGLQLHLSGDVSLDLNSNNQFPESGGTGRWWEFTVRKWVTRRIGATEWSEPENSSFNPWGFSSGLSLGGTPYLASAIGRLAFALFL